MATRYLLHFAHEHTSFRWPEFLAVASRNNCNFRLLSPEEHIQSRPYLFIELEDDTTEDRLIKSASESFLLKDLYEFWARSETVDTLSSEVYKSPHFLSKKFSGKEQPFRINCESFGSKLTQKVKIEYICKMSFMETFESRPDLTNPKQIYCIFEMNEKSADGLDLLSTEYYFGRHLSNSNRYNVDQFSLKRRTFIGNTSMDPLLSLIAANAAKVSPDSIAYDPFVGSGSLLVAAAYMGAFVIGSDIDWLVIHGKSKPSRKGEKKRKDGECIRANLRQYNLETRYLDIMVSDITRRPLRESFKIDAIIADPPYGIRECSEKIGSRRGNKPADDGRLRYPSKINYNIDELLKDLLDLAARHLQCGGRLVYFLPTIKSEIAFDHYIPSHPCLKLISFCEQSLTSYNYRLMIVMEKHREAELGDQVVIPRAISDKNFRKTYFGEIEKGISLDGG